MLGKSDYGLKVGNEATFIVLKADNGAAAVAAAPAERRLVRRGQLIAPAPALHFEVRSG
ncbi:cytosine deaminase [compost metagenome]